MCVRVCVPLLVCGTSDSHNPAFSCFEEKVSRACRCAFMLRIDIQAYTYMDNPSSVSRETQALPKHRANPTYWMKNRKPEMTAD